MPKSLWQEHKCGQLSFYILQYRIASYILLRTSKRTSPLHGFPAGTLSHFKDMQAWLFDSSELYVAVAVSVNN